MIAKFTATETSTYEEDGFLVSGVACRESDHCLMFSKSLPIGDEENWGVEVEFNDQSNCGYDKIKRCSLGRGTLRVDLSEPIDQAMKYIGFEIELRVSDSEWSTLATSLRRVFGQPEDILILE
jgi:hypothetical protein